MIRNHAGDPVKSTARLIETLKKVGIIKTKKRRAKRSLATSDEIRQDNDMGPGFATTNAPPQFGGSPQQQDFNAQRIEDVQRQAGNQIALLRGRIQQLESAPPRIQTQQRITDEQRGPTITEPSSERPFIRPKRPEKIFLDINEFEGARTGPQPAQGTARSDMDFDTTATGIFVGDDEPPIPEGMPSNFTDDDKYKKIAADVGFDPNLGSQTVEQLKGIIDMMGNQFARKITKPRTKQDLVDKIREEAIKQFNSTVTY